jgi:hypothetical protein
MGRGSASGVEGRRGEVKPDTLGRWLLTEAPPVNVIAEESLSLSSQANSGTHGNGSKVHVLLNLVRRGAPLRNPAEGGCRANLDMIA